MAEEKSSGTGPTRAAPCPGTQRTISRAAGVVEAPLDAVTDLLFHLFGQLPPDDRHIELDRRGRRVTVQGDWWFRGVYTLEPHPGGTLVAYRVFNIARRWRWMVPLVLLQYRLSGQLAGMLDVSDLVSRLGERLRCRAYVVGGPWRSTIGIPREIRA